MYVLTQDMHTIGIFEAQLRDLGKHMEAHSKKTQKPCILAGLLY